MASDLELNEAYRLLNQGTYNKWYINILSKDLHKLTGRELKNVTGTIRGKKVQLASPHSQLVINVSLERCQEKTWLV